MLVKGETTFFLKPGEVLENGVEDIIVLGEEEALLLLAKQACKDEKGQERIAGDRWMVQGPGEYITPVEIEKLERRKSMPLDENEGIYVRDLRTGQVKSVKGETYMLTAYEQLWDKELPQAVEDLLNIKNRQKHKIVTYKAPHNSAV